MSLHIQGDMTKQYRSVKKNADKFNLTLTFTLMNMKRSIKRDD